MVLPLLAVVMISYTAHQTTADHGPAWRAFVFALAVGGIMGGTLVRFVPTSVERCPRSHPFERPQRLCPLLR